MQAAILKIAPLALLAAAACGGSSSFNGATIDITSSGLNPAQAVTVPSGGQVRFVNQDSANHQIASSSCSELNSPSALAPNASFTVTLGAGPKTCQFSDSLNPSSTQYQSSIQVNAPGTGGGGGGPGY